jgi:hypothetical protein
MKNSFGAGVGESGKNLSVKAAKEKIGLPI